MASICEANLKDVKRKRGEFFQELVEIWSDNSFRIITPMRGEGNNNKIVLVAEDFNKALEIREFFKMKDIHATSGYKLLDITKKYPVAEEMSRRVIEIHYATNDECLEKIKKAFQSYDKVYDLFF